MAWLSRINFLPSDFLHADYLNNLGLDQRTWGGDVNGGGYTLSNVVIAGLSAVPGAVSSVFGRTGAVVSVAGDYTAAQVGAAPYTRQILTPTGSGLTGGGNLSADITLSAAVVSVFGRTGTVMLTPADVTAATGVLNTLQILTGTGLTGGGNLSADRTISIVPDSVNQQVQILSSATLIGTRHAINFVSGNNVTLTVTDDTSNNRVNVTIASTGSGGFVDPTTTKGDLIVHGLTATTKLPVGTDGQVLTADSTQALGVKWVVGAGVGAVASVFGRTGAVTAAIGDYTAAQVNNAVDQTASYTNPAWITSLPWSKITGAPVFFSDPTTTKGDILVRSASALDRYAVGADGQVLIADSTQAHGVRWGTVSGGPGGGSQTPWTGNIDGGSFTLGNVRAIGVGPVATNSAPATSPYPLYVSVGTAGVDANPSITSVLITDSHNQLQISCSVNYNSSGGGAPWIQAYKFGTSTPTAIILQPVGGQVSIGRSQPGYSLDISGDANVTGTYRINGTPITALSQTPWAQNIDAAGFVLNNTNGIGIGAPAGGLWLNLSYTNPTIRMISPAGADVCMFQLQLGSSYSWEFGIGKPLAGNFYIYDALQAGMRLQIDVNGNFGFGHPATYRIDANGDINCTGVYRVNGVPISAVSSVFGRTGAVVAATGDYTAAQITNAVSAAQVYSDPAWIGSLSWSKITGAPVGGVSSVFARGGAVVAQAGDYTAAQVTNAVSTVSNYIDPVWITSLSWSKVTGAPPIMSDPTNTLGDLIVRGSSLTTQRLPVGTDGQVLMADSTQPLGMHWVTGGGGGGAVASVFTRTGAVVAVAGDYNASQITVSPAVFSATDVQTALTNASTAINGKLSLSGGTLTGALTLAADPTVNLGAATKEYVDSKFTGALHYIGSINASTGNVTYTTASGFTNGPLVAASASPNSYVICTNPGTIPSGPANGITMAMGDWLVSDGTNWSRLQVGTTAITASQVSLAPNVFGASDVQTALGNAQTQVNNKVDTSGSYSNPSWITSLAWSKITGVPSALVSSVFGRTGVVTAQAGDYTAAQVTYAVSTQSTYADPVWISSLSWPKIAGTPNFLIDPLTTGGDLIVHGGGVTTRLPVGTDGQVLTADHTQTLGVRWGAPPSAPVSSVFGRTGVVQAQAGDYTAAQITNAVSTIGSYADPPWITGLSWTKITSVPALSYFQTPWTGNIDGGNHNLSNVSIITTTSLIATSTVEAATGNDALAMLATQLAWYTSGNARWQLTKTGAEGGSNSGSNLVLNSYNDTGTLITNVFTVVRATGNIALGGHVLSGLTALQFNIGSAGLGMPIQQSVANNLRWQWGTNTDAESGSNAGSNLAISRYSDAGALLGTPVTINRATGVVDFAHAPTVAGVPIGGGGGSQTPWTSDIDAATHSLNNLGFLGIGDAAEVGNYPIYIHHNGLSAYAVAAYEDSPTSWTGILLRNDNTAAGNGWGLSVYGSQHSWGAAFQNNLQVGSYQDIFFAVNNSNTEAMRITSAGRVGIGTASPVCRLDVRTPGVTPVINQVHISSNNTDSGAYLGSLNDGNCEIAAGASYNGTTWTAKYTSASVISIGGSMYFAGDSGLTVGSAYTPTTRMVIAATGQVGIGTTSPNEMLTVNGSVRLLGQMTSYAASSACLDFLGGNTRLLSTGANATTSGGFQFITLHSDGSGVYSAVVITPVGLVGIGTSSPLYKLDVRTPGPSCPSQVHISYADADVGAYIVSTVDSQIAILGGVSYTGSQFFAKATSASMIDQNSATMSFYTNSGLTVGSAYAPTVRMHLNSSGNLGIGTSSELYRLDVRNPGVANSQIHVAATDTDAGGYILSTQDSQLDLSGGIAWNPALGWTPKATSGSMVTMQNGGINFYADTGLTVGTAYTPVSRMSVNSSGAAITGSLIVIQDANGLATNIGLAQLALRGASNGNKNIWIGFDTSNNVGVIQPGISGTSWNNLVLNPAGAFVGVHTSAPTASTGNATFQVTGGRSYFSAGGEQYAIGVQFNTGTSSIYFGASDASTTPAGVICNSGGAELIRFANSGNVGIGQSAPAYKLDVSGDIYANGGWFRVSGALGIYFQSYGGGWNMSDGTWIRSYGSKNIYCDQGIVSMAGVTAGIAQIGNSSFTAYGNVYCVRCIGTGTYGAIWYNDGANFHCLLTNANDPWGAYNGLRPFYVTLSTGAVTMGNGLSVAGNLANSGNFTNSGGRILLNAVSEVYGVGMRYSTAQNYSYFGNDPNGDFVFTNPSVVEMARFVVGGGLVCGTPSHITGYAFLATSGSTANTSGGWVVYSSDIRTKKNIRSYMRGLAEVLQMDPIEYEYNGEGGTQPIAGQTYRGLSAQELQKFLPEAVLSRRDKIDGEETDVLTIDMAPIPWVLINAIKELTARLAILEAKLGVN